MNEYKEIYIYIQLKRWLMCNALRTYACYPRKPSRKHLHYNRLVEQFVIEHIAYCHGDTRRLHWAVACVCNSERIKEMNRWEVEGWGGGLSFACLAWMVCCQNIIASLALFLLLVCFLPFHAASVEMSGSTEPNINSILTATHAI